MATFPIDVKINADGVVTGVSLVKDQLGQIDTAGTRTIGVIGQLENRVKQLGAAFVAFKVGQVITSSIRASAEFETALIGVSKTTNLVGQELQSFASRVRDISKELPITTSELLELSKAAGQMGVQGANDLEKFALVIAKLGKASDLSGEFAAQTLARILNVTREGAGSVDVLASVIVALGNDAAAAESQIARMTNEVARATTTFKLSSAEAAAIGTSLAELGVRAERGGTAVGSVMREITKRVLEGGGALEQFTDVLNINSDALVDAFEIDKVDAFKLVLEGIASTGLRAGIALESVGLGGEGISKAILPLANNVDILTANLAIASTEVKNATALNKEFEATLGTVNSQWIVTTNIMRNFSLFMGDRLNPVLDSSLKIFNDFASSRLFTEIGENIDVATFAFGRLIALASTGARQLQALLTFNFSDIVPIGQGFIDQTRALAQELVTVTVITDKQTEATVKVIKAETDLSNVYKEGSSGITDATKARLEFVAGLQIELRNLGKTTAEIRRLDAAELGLGDSANRLLTELEQANIALDEQSVITQQLETDMSAAARIIDEVTTAEERLNIQLGELQRLSAKGLIDPETFKRRTDQLVQGFNKVETSGRNAFGNLDQFAKRGARSIQRHFAQFLFDPFQDGLDGMLKNFINVLRRIAAEAAAARILNSLGVGQLFGGGGGSSGGGGSGFSIFNGVNLLSTGRTIYQGFSGGLLSSGASAVGTLGETFGISAFTSFSAGFSGAATSGVFGAGGSAFLGGQGTAIGGTAATEFGASATAGAAASSSAATAATGFGILALATSIGNQLLANNKEIGGLNSDQLNSLDSTFDSAAGFIGSLSALGTGLTGTKLLGKIPGIGGFLEGIITPFIPDIGGFLTSLFGRGPFKTKETNLIGQATSEGFAGITSTKVKSEGGLFSGDKTKRILINVDTLELAPGSTNSFASLADNLKPSIDLLNFTLDGAISLINDNVSEASKTLGFGTTEGFAANINIASKKGQFFTADQITEELQRIEGEFIRFVIPEIDNLAIGGESLVQTFQRLGLEFEVLSGLGNALGRSTDTAQEFLRGINEVQRNSIINILGGIDEIAAFSNFFAANFLSDSEQLTIASDNLSTALVDAGFVASLTKDQYGDLVKSFGELDGITVQQLASLKALGPAFLNVRDAAEAIIGVAGGGVSDAFSALQQSVSAEIDTVTTLYEAQLDAVATRIDDVTSSVDRLGGLSNSLKSSVADIRGLSKSEAVNQIKQALVDASSGIFPEAETLSRAFGVLTNEDATRFSTRDQFELAKASNANLLSELGEVVNTQLTTEENNLIALNNQSSILTENFGIEIDRLSGILSSAEEQVNVLNGIDTTLLSVLTALNSFNTAQASAEITNGRTNFAGIGGVVVPQQSTPFVGPSPISSQEIRDFVNVAGRTEDQILNAAIANQVSIDQFLNAVGGDSGFTRGGIEDFARSRGVSFADGGRHSGGFRLVGERGPEIELTGPSSISSNAESTKILDSGLLQKEFAEMNARLDIVSESTSNMSTKLDRVIQDDRAMNVRIITD